jgi:hypothetical protein
MQWTQTRWKNSERRMIFGGAVMLLASACMPLSSSSTESEFVAIQCIGISCGGHGVCTLVDHNPTCGCSPGYVVDPVNGLHCLPYQCQVREGGYGHQDDDLDSRDDADCAEPSDASSGEDPAEDSPPSEPEDECAEQRGECTAHDDCEGGQLCDCSRGDRYHPSNRCVYADCRDDSDCGPDGQCSPSPSLRGPEVVGYYCHTPQDECSDHDECGDFCAYDASRGYWRCEV